MTNHTDQDSGYKLYRIILPVEDIKMAHQFYSGILDQEGIRVSPGRHYFNLGGTILACYDPEADGDKSEKDWNFHVNQYIYIAVSDLEKVYDRFIEFDEKLLVSDIQSMPWGERLFYAKDPSGTPICFVDESTKFMGE